MKSLLVVMFLTVFWLSLVAPDIEQPWDLDRGQRLIRAAYGTQCVTRWGHGASHWHLDLQSRSDWTPIPIGDSAYVCYGGVGLLVNVRGVGLFNSAGIFVRDAAIGVQVQ